MRAYLFVAVLLLLIFGGISGYLLERFHRLAGADFTPPPITVASTIARLETLPTTLEAVGSIRARRGVDLSPEASGEIIEIAVDSGETVKTGQLLVKLNDSVEQASRRRQQANLILARQLYERDASLIRQKSIPQSQLDRSRADLDAAIATLAEIEALLDNKYITAPFPGTVGIIRVKVGDYIEPGTTITTLQDLNELEVDFSVPARHYPLLRSGLKISVHTVASNREYPATLQALDSAVDFSTRNLALRARLEESAGLLPGMFARLIIDLDTPREVVTLPETAVTYSLQGNTIYLVEEDAEGLLVNPRVVTTGDVHGGRIVITGGLSPGDRVVSVGQNKLYRGARVVLEARPAAAASAR